MYRKQEKKIILTENTSDKIYPMHPSNYKFSLDSWIIPAIKILRTLDNTHQSLVNRSLDQL